MSITISSFTPAHLPAVRRLVEAAYPRPRSRAYYDWAYLEGPAHRGWVAMDNGRCLALLRAFERDYLLAGKRITCLETFDWYADPQERRGAPGLRVMRAAMDEPLPLVNVGGTADTLAILPRLGWRQVDKAISYTLPLSAGALPPRIARRLGPLRAIGRAGLSTAGRVWFRRSGVGPPSGGEVIPVPCPGNEVLALYRQPVAYSTVPLPDPGHLRWLTGGFSGSGQFLSVYFTIGGALRGWGMARVYTGANGPEAAIVEVFAPRPEPSLYAWMTSELIARLLPYRPMRIRAQATCPALQSALTRTRFLASTRQPAHVWSHGDAPFARPTHFTMSTQDFPMLPYPQRWEFDEPSPFSRSPTPTLEDAGVR